MSGLRIYHPTARSGYFVVEHNSRPYRHWNRRLGKYEAVPLICLICGRAHAVKTYHIVVDADGFALVSHTVWRFLRDYGTGGFVLANEVASPPSQVLNLGTAR